jgi:hypothetical protein
LPAVREESTGVRTLPASSEESLWLAWEPTAPATALEAVFAAFDGTVAGSSESSEPQGSESLAGADPCLALAAALALFQSKPGAGKLAEDRKLRASRKG